MIFLALKTEDGRITGKISFYCRMLGVSRQGFYKYLANKDRPWKYQDLADAMKEIISEDECNDTYGRIRMYQALLLKNRLLALGAHGNFFKLTVPDNDCVIITGGNSAAKLFSVLGFKVLLCSHQDIGGRV